MESSFKIFHGDSLEILKTLPENSIDACVTDSPYGLKFMGKKWDYDVPTTDLWSEVYRVLKPGGHLLSFGGTRTYHRLVTLVELAGFEIRDQVQWIYGSGFPKSLDVSKAIDKAAGAEREVIGHKTGVVGAVGPTGNQLSRPGGKDSSVAKGTGKVTPGVKAILGQIPITAPATDDARTWQGWGTALKPACEPIVLARKPLEKGLTVAENVLKHGTGAINVDGCRIGTEKIKSVLHKGDLMRAMKGGESHSNPTYSENTGRWPANVLLDECAAEMLDEQSGERKSGAMNGVKSNSLGYHGNGSGAEWNHGASSGGASRFFYVAKSSKKDRNSGGIVKNIHPTCKPTKLMEYLCNLICPPGGIILDPFMGSGSTGVAAKRLGFEFIGIEREEEYCEIARRRIEHATAEEQLDLG